MSISSILAERFLPESKNIFRFGGRNVSPMRLFSGFMLSTAKNRCLLSRYTLLPAMRILIIFLFCASASIAFRVEMR